MTEANPALTADFRDYADEVVGAATEAAAAWARLGQEETDRIVAAIARAAFARRVELARAARNETGIGVLEHKVEKNAWASLVVHEEIRGRRTVGVVRDDGGDGIVQIAHARGPILALTPVTNPTSTVIFKCLIAAKTRNPLILSPHGGAKKCSRAAARICLEAALEAGAPEHALQWIRKPQKDAVEAVMRHPRLGLVLATGTLDVVRWAQRSGNPAIGVGPGNVPVYVHTDFDPELAARGIVYSKTFDHGTVCASEQALVVPRAVHPVIRPILERHGAYFCDGAEAERLGKIAFREETRTMAVDVVGRSAVDIAARAEIRVPSGTRVLVAEPAGVGRKHPLSHEILAPILAYYVADDLEAAAGIAERVSRLGGVGHTLGVWTNDRSVVDELVRRVPAARVLVNQPTTQGAVGGLTNRLPSSLTLGTGSGGGNLTTDNITVDHLLSIQRVVDRRPNRAWNAIEPLTWMDEAVDPAAVAGRYRERS